MFCTKCGKKADRGKYCIFCGGMLHEKTLDFDNTKTLMRYNLKIENLPKSEDTHKAPLNDEGKEKSFLSQPNDTVQITQKADNSHVSQHTDNGFTEDVGCSVESRMNFLSEIPDKAGENANEVSGSIDLNETDKFSAENSFNEETDMFKQPTDDIKEETSDDSFLALMNDLPEETTEPEETVIPVEEVQVEETTHVGVESIKENETLEQSADGIKEDISYDSFAELMSSSAEAEEITETEENLIFDEEVQTEESTTNIEERNEYSEKAEDSGDTKADGYEQKSFDTLEKETTESRETGKTPDVTIPYSDIDPMFGPPPTMEFTVKPHPQKAGKEGIFKRKKR